MKVVSPLTAIIYGYKAEVKLMQMFFRIRAVWSIFVVGEGKSYSRNATVPSDVSPTVVSIISFLCIFTQETLFSPPTTPTNIRWSQTAKSWDSTHVADIYIFE